MAIDLNQLEELKKFNPNVQVVIDGGVEYLFLPNVKLPAFCTPSGVDCLLCPIPQDGYVSRLFFSQKITTKVPRNWNGQRVIIGRTWYAISWQTQGGHTLSTMFFIHLNAVINET